MTNIFVFDVDNTLTPPRQKITADMKEFFSNFVVNNKVYLVSGSDYEKIIWQLGEEITGLAAGVFGCLGNTHHVLDLLVSMNQFAELNQEQLLRDINEFLKNSLTPFRTGNHIEKRIGMLNISSVGRNASIEERKSYSMFDKQMNERKIFADFLQQKYPELDISIGGEISIDISVKGYGKEQIYQKILLENKEPRVIFFGDRCNLGGNDYNLAERVQLDNGLVFNVDSYAQTKLILEKIWNGNSSIR